MKPVALLLVTACACFAQAPAISDVGGDLTGTIYNASGAVVPTAKVVAHNDATGVEKTATTTSAGDYRVANLPAGTYTISLTAAGFAKADVKGVQIELNVTSTANVTLQDGNSVEIVEVGVDVQLNDCFDEDHWSAACGRWSAELADQRMSERKLVIAYGWLPASDRTADTHGRPVLSPEDREKEKQERRAVRAERIGNAAAQFTLAMVCPRVYQKPIIFMTANDVAWLQVCNANGFMLFGIYVYTGGAGGGR